MQTQQLAHEFQAVRLSFRWLGTSRTLSKDQSEEAASTFEADRTYLSASKKLLNTKHEKYKAVTKWKGAIRSYWEARTVPFPENGVRLLKRSEIQGFRDRMSHYAQQLDLAVAELDEVYEELKVTAQIKLGRLFNPSDYPATLVGQYGFNVDFPSVSPPDYLRELDPALYEEQVQRMHARFSEAIAMAEEAFTAEFSNLVDHIVERLDNNEEGKRKKFGESVIGNLNDFFERFRDLNVGNNQQLDELVNQAQGIVQGAKIGDIKEQASLRLRMQGQFKEVSDRLETMMVNRPRRQLG